MDTIDDLYRLLLEREKTFQEKTQDMFGQLDFLTDAVVRHLDVPRRDIGWISIDKIGRELVIMVSIPNDEKGVYVVPGTTATQHLTIVLPESVVETGDSYLIQQFLDETFDIRKYDGNSDIDSELTGIVSVSESTRRTLH